MHFYSFFIKLIQKESLLLHLAKKDLLIRMYFTFRDFSSTLLAFAKC